MFLAVAGFLVTWVLMIAILSVVQRALTGKGDVSTRGKGQHRRRRNSTALWVLILFAIAYGCLVRYLHTLTGSAMLDGSIGLSLGLYICSHPAANAIDILFCERDTLHDLSEESVIRWLALNVLVLLAGWIAVFVGVRRLVDMPV
jgi:hypothetical protein